MVVKRIVLAAPRFKLFGLAVLVLTLGLPSLLHQPSPVLARAVTLTTSTSAPVSLTVFVPCALGGKGEDVNLRGSIHEMLHITVNENGIQTEIHSNPQGVSGTGAVSGGKYQGTGVTKTQENSSASGALVLTFVNNFRIIGAGLNSNLSVHSLIHVTVNANGVATAEVATLTIDCAPDSPPPDSPPPP